VWDLLYVQQMSKPQNFQELATKVHDMEVMIANHCGNSVSLAESKKSKGEFKRNADFSKNSQGGDVQCQGKAHLNYGKAKIGREKECPF